MNLHSWNEESNTVADRYINNIKQGNHWCEKVISFINSKHNSSYTVSNTVIRSSGYNDKNKVHRKTTMFSGQVSPTECLEKGVTTEADL